MRVGRLAFWEGERFTHHVNENGEDEYVYNGPVENKKLMKNKDPIKGNVSTRLLWEKLQQWYYIYIVAVQDKKQNHSGVAMILRRLAAAMDKDEEEDLGLDVELDTHMEIELDKDHPEDLSNCRKFSSHQF